MQVVLQATAECLPHMKVFLQINIYITDKDLGMKNFAQNYEMLCALNRRDINASTEA